MQYLENKWFLYEIFFLMEVDAHSFLKILKVFSYISVASSSKGAEM